jgi:hypothetical protein
MDWILHILTQIGITSNYNATANLHNSQITTAPAKLFPAFCVFTSSSLATASNSEDSSVSRPQVLSSQPPVQNSCLLSTLLSLPCRTQPHCQPSTDSLPCLLNYSLSWPGALVTFPRDGPNSKHSFQQFLYCFTDPLPRSSRFWFAYCIATTVLITIV